MRDSSSQQPDHNPAYELELWRIHKTNPNTAKGADAVEHLLKLHNSMLSRIATAFHQRYKHVGTRDDFLQEARIGALYAYGRFDELKNVRDMRHYINETVYRHLLSYTDRSGFVRVHPHQRAVRNYLDGRYDQYPAKKQAFETKHKLHNDELRSDFSTKYSLLVCDIISMESYVEGGAPQSIKTTESGDSFDIASHDQSQSLLSAITVAIAMKTLSTEERDVINMMYEDGRTVSEIARALSFTPSKVIRLATNAKKALKEVI